MVNEASLTGESIPVPKITVPKNDLYFEQLPINTLYEGTRIVQTNGDTLALVHRIGFLTQKGQYFRNVLFPKKQFNPFFINALKFTLGIFIMMHIFYFAGIKSMIDVGIGPQNIFIRWLDIATWIFPPQIPVAI